jgi:hypothetical protein
MNLGITTYSKHSKGYNYTYGLGIGFSRSVSIKGASARVRLTVYSLEFIFGPFVLAITWEKVC